MIVLWVVRDDVTTGNEVEPPLELSTWIPACGLQKSPWNDHSRMRRHEDGIDDVTSGQ